MTPLVQRLVALPPSVVLRRSVGLALNLAGAVLLATWLAAPIVRDAAAREALLASLIAGAATGLGALMLVLWPRRPSGTGRTGGQAGHDEAVPSSDAFMPFAAGLMLAAAVFSLLLPALEAATRPLALDVVIAALAGAWLMAALDRALPHRHPAEVGGGPPSRPGGAARDASRSTVLLITAIAVHNLPEGFAVGAGFGGDAGLGWRTALSIGVQNLPEGLIVATALASLGLGRVPAILGALATGLIEPVGAALGIVASGLSAATLPIALAMAGGAMLFVVAHEGIPALGRRRPAPLLATRGPAGWAMAGLPSGIPAFAAGFAGMALIGLL